MTGKGSVAARGEGRTASASTSASLLRRGRGPDRSTILASLETKTVADGEDILDAACPGIHYTG